MDLLLKTLKILLLGVLILGPTGCATSDEDLNYSQKKIDDSGGDSSYHGWSAPPKEVDPSLQ